MKTIHLIDGGFFSKKFTKAFKNFPISSDVIKFISKLNIKYNNSFQILRIYYYDCPPLDKKVEYPISGKDLNLKLSKRYKENEKLLKDLKREDFVSVREGFLTGRGWRLKENAIQKIRSNQPLQDSDFILNIKQKGTDLKIGLDIAWISLKKIAERIILITGDSDFIPAMKFARRSGIQVFLSTLDHVVSDNLKDHSDVLILDDIQTILS